MTFIVQNISGRAQTEPKTLVNVALTETKNNWPIGSIDYVADELINIYIQNPSVFQVMSGPIIGAPGIISGAVTANAAGTKVLATVLVGVYNRIATAASAGASVLMPPALAGSFAIIINDTTNPIQIYGAGTDIINDVVTATGVTQMAQSMVVYSCALAGQWVAAGLGVGYNGSFETSSYADALTANAGGVQAAATPITTSIARFTTVAALGNSAVLPAAAPGLTFTVINAAAANQMNVFPAGTDVINAGAASAAFVQPAGSVTVYYSTVAGKWHTIYYNPIALQQVYNTNAATTTATLTAANITGASSEVVLGMTGTLGAGVNLQMPTVASVIAAIPNATIGSTYKLRIINNGAGAFAWTIVTNTTWTLNGTMSIAQNTTRDFIVTITGATTGSLTSVGTGTWS